MTAVDAAASESREGDGGMLRVQLEAERADARARALVVFSLDDQRYALPLEHVQRSIRVIAITPLPEAPPFVRGVIDLGGTLLPVIDTRLRFNHPPRPLRLSDHLVIATTGRRTVALLVDETQGVVEATAANSTLSGELLSRTELVPGAVKLPDGLILIVDLERVLLHADAAAIDDLVSAAAASQAPVDGGSDDEPEGGARDT